MENPQPLPEASSPAAHTVVTEGVPTACTAPLDSPLMNSPSVKLSAGTLRVCLCPRPLTGVEGDSRVTGGCRKSRLRDFLLQTAFWSPVPLSTRQDVSLCLSPCPGAPFPGAPREPSAQGLLGLPPAAQGAAQPGWLLTRGTPQTSEPREGRSHTHPVPPALPLPGRRPWRSWGSAVVADAALIHVVHSGLGIRGFLRRQSVPVLGGLRCPPSAPSSPAGRCPHTPLLGSALHSTAAPGLLFSLRRPSRRVLFCKALLTRGGGVSR